MAALETSGSGAPDRTIRVLLIEAEPEKIFLIKELLKGIGTNFSVSVAEGGRKALEVLDRAIGKDARPIDLVIMESVRAEVESSEVLAYMRSMHGLQNIPVVVMVKSAKKVDGMSGHGPGTVHYTVRPSIHSEFEAMQALIRKIMDLP